MTPEKAIELLRKELGDTLFCCGCPVPGHPGDGWMQPPDPPECCGDPITMETVIEVLKKELSRVKEMEELLKSANAIAQREGQGTAWKRFSESIRQLGIGSVTARTYRILPSDYEPTA